MSADNIFTAAMVQMRTGLLPEPSLEQATRLIREAAAQVDVLVFARVVDSPKAPI